MKQDKRDPQQVDWSLMTPKEVSELFRISLNGLYRLVERRVLPFCRVGHQLRFRRVDVEEYLRRNSVKRVEAKAMYGRAEAQEKMVG